MLQIKTYIPILAAIAFFAVVVKINYLMFATANNIMQASVKGNPKPKPKRE